MNDIERTCYDCREEFKKHFGDCMNVAVRKIER